MLLMASTITDLEARRLLCCSWRALICRPGGCYDAHGEH